MITVQKLNSLKTFKDYDYSLEKMENLTDLLCDITPKFEGNWIVLLIDFKISDIKYLLDTDVVPDFVDCHIFVNNEKYKSIILDYPKLSEQDKTVKEMFLDVVKTLNHLIDKKAMWDLYKTIGPNITELSEALYQLDTDCEHEVITLKDVRMAYGYKNITYASEVIEAFYDKSKNRWQLLNKLVTDLGLNYAYYALQKHVIRLLKGKQQYLTGKQTSVHRIRTIDAPYISYAYILFKNSTGPKSLYSVMYALDNRSEDTYERIYNVNLQ